MPASPVPSAENLPPLLTTFQTVKLVNVGQRTLWRWSRSGIAPRPIRIGASTVRYVRDEILAWIKIRQGYKLNEHEVRDHCRAHLAHFKTPRYVKFVESFPTTVTGKIQKFKIRELAIQELGLEEAARIETA